MNTEWSINFLFFKNVFFASFIDYNQFYIKRRKSHKDLGVVI